MRLWRVISLALVASCMSRSGFDRVEDDGGAELDGGTFAAGDTGGGGAGGQGGAGGDSCLGDCSPWWDVTFPHRAAITIDPAVTPAAFEPFVVRAELLLPAGPSEAVLAFVTAAGVELAFETESFDAATGRWVGWLRLTGEALPVVGHVYAGAASPREPASPWHAEDLAVFHFDDPSADARGQVTATVQGTVETGEGPLGSTLSLDGAGFLSLATEVLETAPSFTVTAWLQTSSTAYAHHVFYQGSSFGNGWGDGSDSYEMHLSLGDIEADGYHDDRLSFFFGNDDVDTTADVLSHNTAFSDVLGWHHVAIVVEDLDSSPRSRIYLDGALRSEDVGTVDRVDRTGWDSPFLLGSSGSGERAFVGQIDELHIVAGARSADWVAAEFANQSATDSVALGSFQERDSL